MADELLKALAKRQREADTAQPPIPLDDFEGDAGDALLDDMFGALEEKSAPAIEAPVAAPGAPADDAVPDNVAELPKRRGAVWAGAGIAIAAAAALALWLAMPSEITPLPAYGAVSIAGGPAAVRGDHDATVDVLTLEQPTDNVELRFAPATAVDGDIEVVLSARRDDGERIFAAVANPNVTPSGSVELRGPLNSFIDLGEGHWTLEVIFARAGQAPTSADGSMREDWPRVPIEVIIDAS